MFGRNLAETVMHEFRKTGGFIPIFVERCVEFIRERGLLVPSHNFSFNSVTCT